MPTYFSLIRFSSFFTFLSSHMTQHKQKHLSNLNIYVVAPCLDECLKHDQHAVFHFSELNSDTYNGKQARKLLTWIFFCFFLLHRRHHSCHEKWVNKVWQRRRVVLSINLKKSTIFKVKPCKSSKLLWMS